MNPLMNFNEPYEPFWGVQGLFKKTSRIFFIVWCFLVFLGSLMFICFINLAMRSKIAEVVRQDGCFITYLMNLMNIYEVRVFNRFFEKVDFLTGELMNMKKHPTSLKFIKQEVLRGL